MNFQISVMLKGRFLHYFNFAHQPCSFIIYLSGFKHAVPVGVADIFWLTGDSSRNIILSACLHDCHTSPHNGLVMRSL